MAKRKQEEEVVTEEILEQAQAEMTPKIEPEKPSRSSAFEKVLNDFSENEGWVHIKLKKDNQAPVKIGKFRPNEFDKDEIARQYGGGVYYYDLRDKEGKRVATDEERYADNLLAQKGTVQDTGLNQALDLIKQLAGEIAKVKQEISKPQIIQQPPQEDKKTDLILEMIKQQNQQSLEMMKSIAQMSRPQEVKQNSIDDVLKMITVLKGLIPEPPKPAETEKPSMADAVELASVLADLKDNGGQVNNQSLTDVIKTFLTDGSLGNIIAMLKQKPIIPPPVTQSPVTQSPVTQSPVTQSPVTQSQVAPQQSQVAQEAMPQEAMPQEAQATKFMLDFYKQYEKTLFDMKVNGSTADEVGDTICNLTNLQPEFKTIAYIFFEDVNKACEQLMSVSQLFRTDKQYILDVCNYIHSYFYDVQTEPEQSEPEQNIGGQNG